MDVLQYFDSEFKASVQIESISTSNKIVLIIYIEDLIKLANERLSEELNWILDCVLTDQVSFDFSTISKSIRKSMQKSYFDTNNKKTIIDYVLSLTKNEIYNQFIIEKAIEILSIIVNQSLDNKLSEINVIFGGFQDIDDLLARKRQNSINTLICQEYQQQHIKNIRKNNKYIKQEWNTSNLTPGTVFMQQVHKQFKRSNLDFIQCSYRIIEDTLFGSVDYKVKQLLEMYHKQNKLTNILVFARTRQSTLQLLNYCNETGLNVYLQLIDIINLPEYEIQPINLQQVIKQMTELTNVYIKNKRSKKETIRDLIVLISLFRNPYLELPICTEFISIPCILGIYRYFLQLSKETLINDKYDINPHQFAIILQIISELNIFYNKFQQQIQKKPNLLFLHIINALKIKQNQIQIGKRQLIEQSKLFPDNIITNKSTDKDIKQILQYNDFYYEEPEITFLNINYQSNNFSNIHKDIFKHFVINKQIIKQVKQRNIQYTNSIEMCQSYLLAIQKIIYKFRLQQVNNEFNVFNYQFSLYPDIDSLISYCNQKSYNFNNSEQILMKYNKKTHLKSALFALLTIPCDYIQNNNQEYTQNMFSKEVQLNIQKMQKQYSSLFQTVQTIKQRVEMEVTVNNLNLYTIYSLNVRFKEFLMTDSQISILLNDIIPQFNKIFIPKV